MSEMSELVRKVMANMEYPADIEEFIQNAVIQGMVAGRRELQISTHTRCDCMPEVAVAHCHACMWARGMVADWVSCPSVRDARGADFTLADKSNLEYAAGALEASADNGDRYSARLIREMIVMAEGGRA